jgi:nucleotide-binding universal stress UspA family protein
MLNTILVPLDGSPMAESALEPAMLLARRCEADLVLVRALDLDTFSEGSTRAEATHEAQRYLKSITDYLRSEDIVVRTVVLPLEAAEGIIEEATFNKVDLIVMATHGRKGIHALLHPSVTWQVLRQANAPILTYKCQGDSDPAAQRLHLPHFMTNPRVPILVALDGSLQAEEALPIARELAHTFGNPLLLVRAGEIPYIAGGVMGYEEIVGQAWEWSLEEAENYLKRKAAELASTGIKVQTKSAVGAAAPFIQQVAAEREVGLVIIASHGRGWMGRFAMGSVARHILQEIETPVLLVRRHPLTTPEEPPSGTPAASEKQNALR